MTVPAGNDKITDPFVRCAGHLGKSNEAKLDLAAEAGIISREDVLY